MRTPRLLMCPPDYFGIEYEINPWMHKEVVTDHELAVKQWNDLVALFRSLGTEINLMKPVSGLPDMVFTANAGVVYRDLFVTSHFRHKERQGESEHFDAWMKANGFHVSSLSKPLDFEGAGDALFCGDILFAGYLHRSEIRAHHLLGEMLGVQTLGLELVDPRFYHLDTCFCPLAPGIAIYYPGAFDEYGRQVLVENVPNLIAVEEADAVRFACNSVVLGQDVVFNAGCDQLGKQLAQHGFRPHQTPLGEFLKSGGSAKCLTLRLDGEEAANWSRAAE